MPIDSALGRLGIKQGVCTSSTRPTNPFEGQVIYESDTNRTLVYDNAAWVVVADNQVLSIDSTNGRVGIGTDTPEANLDINGNTPSLLFTSPTDTNRYRIDANISDAADFGLSLGYWDGAAYQRTLTVDDTGKVGINDTAPSYPLDVTGDINATGDVRVGGVAINGNLVTGSTYYFTDNSQYAPEYGSNYYRTALYTVSAPSGKSISSVQLTTRSSAPAWVTITAQSSSSYSYYVWSKGASTGYVNYFLDCR